MIATFTRPMSRHSDSDRKNPSDIIEKACIRATAPIALLFSLVVRLASEAQLVPQGVDALFDRVVHYDGTAPFAIGFAGPLVGGVEAHLRSQSGHRRSEIQIVDRRAIDQHRVARRIDARGD